MRRAEPPWLPTIAPPPGGLSRLRRERDVRARRHGLRRALQRATLGALPLLLLLRPAVEPPAERDAPRPPVPSYLETRLHPALALLHDGPHDPVTLRQPGRLRRATTTPSLVLVRVEAP